MIAAASAMQPQLSPVFPPSTRMRAGLAAFFGVVVLNLWLLCSFTTTSVNPTFHAQQFMTLLRRSAEDEASAPTNSQDMDEEIPVGFRPRRTHFFSFAEAPEQQVCILAAGLAQYGYELNVLGWNKSEHFADNSTCGDPCKLQKVVMKTHERKIYWQYDLTQKYADYGIHDDDLIVFMDAYDVLVQSDPGRLTELFLEQTRNQRGVVFNGEPTMGNSFLHLSKYGQDLRKRTYEIQLTLNHARRNISGGDISKMMVAKSLMMATTNGPFFGLNSGIFIGDAVTLKAFFERVLEVRELMLGLFRGDQILYQIAYLQYPELNLVVDVSASISYVTSYLYREGDVDLFTYHQEGSKTTMTCLAAEYLTADTPGSKVHYAIDTEPVFMHFPGFFEALYNEVCWMPAWEVLFNTITANTSSLRDFDRSTDVPLSSFCRMPTTPHVVSSTK